MASSSNHISPTLNLNKSINETWKKPFLKFGHGGAAGLAPANTLESLEMALAMGVDVVEFDVRPCADALVLLHDDSLKKFNSSKLASQCTLNELRSMDFNKVRKIATLNDALNLLKGRCLINIDLKADGYEAAVHDLVAKRGLAADVIYSSVIASSLRHMRELSVGAMIGLSYPEDRGDASSKPILKPMVNGALLVMRLTLPFRILTMMANAQANAVMLYHRVISSQSINKVQQAGGRVFTWTVDDPARMHQLQKLRVNGITTNHPELFNIPHEGITGIR